MSASEATTDSSESTVLANSESTQIEENAGASIAAPIPPKLDAELINIQECTVRTHTVIIDATSASGTDVGVQATPAAVFADLECPHKHQRGILPITSDMRNSATVNAQNQQDNHHSVTNTKEKTPMCLVNELARYNKLTAKYELEDEKGPAHKKEFKIRLDLGAESYHAISTSIKRAQHAAAEVALGATKLKKPVMKSQKCATPPVAPDKKKVPTVTPTVELNALAMKLGEQAQYTNIDPPHPPHLPPHYFYPGIPPPYHHPHHRMPHQIYSNIFMPPHIRSRMLQPFTVALRIGRHEFKGQGVTRQLARHNAANKALRVLKHVPLQRLAASPKETKEQRDEEPTPYAESAQIAESAESPEPTSPDVESNSVSSTSADAADLNGACKSEISQVHEMALQYGRPILFEVIHESGPPHMRNFVTRCICGNMTSEAEGNSKKKSKKTAAESMLAKLAALNEPKVAASRPKVKNVANKKKNRNLIKMQKANVEYGSGINPISRLIQIQQANKRKEPIYSLVMEHGLPRRREFIIQVACNDKTCQGKGPNKKLAKRNAAEEMLQLMGYSQPSPAPGKSVLKSPDHSHNSPLQHNKHVTFLDSTQTNKLPGVLVRKDTSGKSFNHEMPPFKADLAASLAKELLEQGRSIVGETLLPAKEHPKCPLEKSKEQLEYLGSCMGFAIEFTDFPKGNNTNMCLTLVTLQTNPAQVFHGSASTVEASHDKAALQALKKLAQTAQDGDNAEEITPPVPEVKKVDSNEEKSEKDVVDGAGDVAAKPITNGEIEHE